MILRIIKKVSILVAAVLILFSVSAFADSLEKGNEDVYCRKQNFLVSIGAVKQTVVDFSAQVGRNEFREALFYLGGERLPIGAAENEENGLTLLESVKMVMTELGYDVLFSYKYKTDVDIIAAAKDLNLLSGVNYKADREVTYGDMVCLFYNALFAHTLDMTGINAGERPTYEEGELLLECVYDIYTAGGILTATPITSILSMTGAAQNGYIKVGNTVFRAEQDAYKYIGRYVRCFYKVSGDTNIAVYVEERYDNSSVSIHTNDVRAISATRVNYAGDNGKIKKANIKKYASFVYNGKLKSVNDIDLTAFCGTITLIDNDNNSTYDVVLLDTYVDFKITGVDRKNCKISGKNNISVSFDSSPNNLIYDIISDLGSIKFEELRVGDVLSVCESANTGIKYIKAYVSRKKLEGIIESVDTDSQSVSLEENVYTYDSRYISPKVSDYGVYYLNWNNVIVDSELENYVVYGYLYRMAKTPLGKVTVKIFSDRGRWVELTVRSKVLYNGGKTDATQLFDKAGLCSSGVLIPQLVTYRVNSDNEVYMINTALTVEHWSEEEEQAIKNGQFRLSQELSSANYRSGVKSFGMENFLSDESFIFVVPGNYGDTSVDEEKVRLVSSGSLVGDTSYSNLYIYDLSDIGEIRAMVIYDDITKIKSTNIICPVVSKGGCLGPDGEWYDMIEVLYNGIELMLAVSDDAVIDGTSKIEIGDSIRYAQNSEGLVVKIALEYRHNDVNYMDKVNTSGNSSGNVYHKQTRISGIVDRIDFEQNKMVLKYGDLRVVYDISAVTNVYKHTVSEKTTEVYSLQDLCEGERVYMYVNYGKVKHIIVYED